MSNNFNRGADLGGPKQREVEAEYGEPFVDVLRGFADMGYGINTTAKIIGYNIASFRQLLNRRADDWVIDWPALKDQVIMTDRVPFTDERRRKISEASLRYQAECRAERRRQGVMSESERRAAAKLSRAERVQPDNSSHCWRRM